MNSTSTEFFSTSRLRTAWPAPRLPAHRHEGRTIAYQIPGFKIARDPIPSRAGRNGLMTNLHLWPSQRDTGEHRLVCRRFAPKSDQVRRNDVFHRTRRCRNTDRCFQPTVMAHGTHERRIDRCNTHQPQLPGEYTSFVSSTREVHPNPVGRGRTNCIGGER